MAKAAARAKSNSNDVDSSPPSKNVASSKKSKKVQEDEEMVEDVVDDAVEDEEDEEEAYEIERIVKGQMGKNQKVSARSRRLAFSKSSMLIEVLNCVIRAKWPSLLNGKVIRMQRIVGSTKKTCTFCLF